MSEASAQQNELKAQKRPKFVRQLSKSYEKGKEVVKRNLLTPRGPRTAKSAELPLPAPGVKTPSGIDSSPQVCTYHVPLSGALPQVTWLPFQILTPGPSCSMRKKNPTESQGRS